MLQREMILRGTVEGVGMRPALYRYSVAHGLNGFVCNLSGCVRLVWQGRADQMEEAFRHLPDCFPEGSSVESPLTYTDSNTDCILDSFRILPSDSSGRNRTNRLTPPDRAPCPACLEEIRTSSDRHFRHAFNSCAVCGPRATVVRHLPYEREHTAWLDFPLCAVCRKEYENPSDRRFHVEGISCPVCGPRLEFRTGDGAPRTSSDPIAEAAALLKCGGILALKGVGGFQLLADPRQESAIRRLRELKRRREKPLALMASSLAVIRKYCRVEPIQERALTDGAAPIVLLEWSAGGGFHPELIAPDGTEEVGVMLPSSPLHVLLMDAFGGDFLIATSGNRGGEPPALDTESALAVLRGRVDGFLTHNRPVFWRHDDSLAAVNRNGLQIWRRARGCSQSLPWRVPGRVLAMGGVWKNTFALTDCDMFLLSPHHGGLEDAANADAWLRAVNDQLRLSGSTPETIAVDLHPDYYSSIAGARLAESLSASLCRVPHHYAHALAGLLESGEERALALVFDGTGLGPDGTLWGAELLDVSLRNGGFRRGTWNAAPLPGGELAVREPWRQYAARCFAAGLSPEETIRRLPAFRDRLELLHRQFSGSWNTPMSSSAGRLFDAASALFGAAPERITYEGQAAIRLESAAKRRTPSRCGFVPWRLESRDGIGVIDWSPLFRDPLPSSYNEMDFHESVADAAAAMVKFFSGADAPKTVILTGGVFQNRLLAALTAERLEREGYRIFLPRIVPPNDGGISVGQAVWGGLHFQISGVNYAI